MDVVQIASRLLQSNDLQTRRDLTKLLFEAFTCYEARMTFLSMPGRGKVMERLVF